MNRSLTTLLAVGIAGMIFYPDETRDIAWKTVGAIGNVAADVTADAALAVDDRIEERRGDTFPTRNTFLPPADRQFRSGSRPVRFRDRESDGANEPAFVILNRAPACPPVR